jgi:hypothetical protein
MKTVLRITAESCRPAPTPPSGSPLYRRSARSADFLRPDGTSARVR